MTEKSLATIETTMQAITFTSSEIAFIKEHLGENLTEMEFKLFIATAMYTGANPLLGEIFAIKYKGEQAKMAIVYHHDFLIRRVNEAFGDFEGFTSPEYWDGEKWLPIWTGAITATNHLMTAPQACRIGVKRKGWREPAYATVLWRERAKVYDGKLQSMWLHNSIGMITKCAQVAALRDAYGSIVGSMITEHEIDRPQDVEGMLQTPSGDWRKADQSQSNPNRVMETKELKAAILNPAAAPLDRDRKARLLKIRQETDLGSDAFRAVVTSVIEREVDKMTELTCGEADQVIAHFNREAACEHPPTA